MEENPISRRNFIKQAGLATLGAGVLLATEQAGLADVLTKKESFDKEIEECRAIIQNERYEEIIKNPFLVSALYYSRKAIKKMAPPHQNSNERVIWTIYPLLTKQFRD